MVIDAIIYGRQAERQGRRLADLLGAETVSIQHKIFPDGEHYLRITDGEGIRGRGVLIVNTMYPRQNDSLLETLMLIDAVKRLNPHRILLLVTYLAYARQDKVFLTGEPVTGRIVLDSIYRLGIDYLLVVDIHSGKLLEPYNDRAENVLVSDILAGEALKNAKDPLILAPDKGALHRAKYAAERHGLEYDYLVKHRDRVTGEIYIEPKEVDVNGRDVIIVDDIISTGGTIASATRNMLRLGARRVFVAATHSLLVGNALEKIKSSGAEMIITADTLGIKHDDPFVKYVDILPKLASVIRNRG